MGLPNCKLFKVHVPTLADLDRFGNLSSLGICTTTISLTIAIAVAFST